MRNHNGRAWVIDTFYAVCFFFAALNVKNRNAAALSWNVCGDRAGGVSYASPLPRKRDRRVVFHFVFEVDDRAFGRR